MTRFWWRCVVTCGWVRPLAWPAWAREHLKARNVPQCHQITTKILLQLPMIIKIVLKGFPDVFLV